MHDDSQGQKQPLLSEIPTEGDATIMFSQIHNKLVKENRKKDLNEITLAYDLNIEKIAKARQEASGIDDPSMIRLTEEDFALAKYDAVMDLVTISGDLKTIKVTPYSKFINQQALVDNEIADERQDMVQEGNKIRPSLVELQGVPTLRLGTQQVTVQETLNKFQDQIENDIENKDGTNKEIILQQALDSDFPPELHGQVLQLYQNIITPEEKGPRRLFEMSTTPYGGSMLPIGTVVEGRKKK